MRARARTRTHRIRRKKVDCLSAAGYDNRWTVMRINSRRVEKSWIGRFFSARYTPRFANKQTVSTRRLSPPPLFRSRLSIISAWKRRGEVRRGEGKDANIGRTLSLRIDRSIFFIFRTAKNFSIFATLPSGCYRVSIFHFVGAESSDRGDAAQITSTPANKEGREERRGGKREIEREREGEREKNKGTR